jgi:hypothetical protein
MNVEDVRSISDCRDELQKIETWINKNPMDSNIKFLVAYAVIKSSGTVEIVFKRMIYSFLVKGSTIEAQKYLEKDIIDSSANPKTGVIEKYIEQFDNTRKDTFKNDLSGSQEKSDLNSLVKLRNDIAHGRDITTSIATVKRYFESGVFVLNKLDQLL